jgi:nucleoside-diphosphate-sugar epimerase
MSSGGFKMKVALIIGITGNFGGQMAQTLFQNGWQIRALMRDKSKAPSWLPSSQIHVGSALDENAVLQAAQGVNLVVYAANPAYHRWHEEAMLTLEPTVHVAEKLGLRILFPGNVYGYSPESKAKTESDVMEPPTDKGEIRLRMETRLKLASQNGAMITIIRAGDFLGPNMHLGWLDYMLKEKKGCYSLAMPHNKQHVHYWTYLPDLCANTVKLIESPESDFDVWHDPGLALTKNDWNNAFADNCLTLKTKNFPWWFFKVVSPFSPMLREVLKMQYLWQSNVIMDGTKLKKKLGSNRHQTSLTKIVAALLRKQDVVELQFKAV